MNKIRAFFEGLMYVVIGIVGLRIGHYLYSYIVYDKILRGDILSSPLFDSPQEQAIDYIKETGILYLGISWLVIILISVLAIKLSKEKVFDHITFISGPTDVVMGVLAGLGAVLFTFTIGQIMSMFFDLSGLQAEESVLFYDNLLLTFLSVGIGIPFFEELFFRGIVMNRFSHTGNGFISILTTSICFLISHFDLYQGIYLIPLTIITGLAVYQTKSLMVGVVIHMVFNAMNIWMNLYYEFDYQLGQLLIICVLGFMVMTFALSRMSDEPLVKHSS